MLKTGLTTFFAAVALTTAAFAQVPANPGDELIPMRLEAGVWDATITFPNAPEGQPKTGVGVQDNTLRSNGNWLINEFHIEGLGYSGTGLWGWDAATKRYVGVWGDSNEHRMRQDIGFWNADTQTMVWHADLVRRDGMVTPMKLVSVYKGEDRTFDIYQIGYKTGAETHLVHMDFRRRPGTAPAVPAAAAAPAGS